MLTISEKNKSDLKYSDYEAHKLAIGAMIKFTKETLKDLEEFTVVKSINNIDKMHLKRKLMVWMPSVDEIDNFDIPKNWDTTSDAIALAVSKTLNCPLLLVKSVRFNKKNFLNPFFLKNNLLDKYCENNYKNFHRKFLLLQEKIL